MIEGRRLLLNDLVSALMLLTRLPVGRWGGAPDLRRCVWAFPVVGLIVNGMGGLVYWLAHRVGMPPLLGAAWTLAFAVIVTGGFHEDGLADTADGFGGGGTRERTLEIMRDSRIGSYGALALLLSVIVRVAAISALGEPKLVLAGMSVAGMLGRAGVGLLPLFLASARDDGMGASLGRPRAASAGVGVGLAAGAAFLWLPAVPAVVVVVFGFGASLAVARLAVAQIGGFTGDVLGAAEVCSECVVLTVVASALGV